MDFGGIYLNWFQFYLGNRKQLVRAQGINYKLKTVTYGGLHGSVLDPIIFLLFWSNSNIANLHITAYFFKIKSCVD